MSLAALREAINLLVTRPVLWIPGLLSGLLAALLLIIAYTAGIFFAMRLSIIVLLALVWLAVIVYTLVPTSLTLWAAIKEGTGLYFRVLTPLLVIVFGIFLVFFLVVGTLALAGIPPDSSVMTFLSFGVMLPSVLLTFFTDCAAVFEKKKVFEAIQRSIEVVTINLFESMLFYIGCFLIWCAVSFVFFVAWTATLADQLEPITHYNETQYAAFTPQDLLSLVGPNGVWIAAVCVFGTVAILFPLLHTYKACFYRAVSGTTIPIRQVSGEFDSKGRWYKY